MVSWTASGINIVHIKLHKTVAKQYISYNVYLNRFNILLFLWIIINLDDSDFDLLNKSIYVLYIWKIINLIWKIKCYLPLNMLRTAGAWAFSFPSCWVWDSHMEFQNSRQGAFFPVYLHENVLSQHAWRGCHPLLIQPSQPRDLGIPLWAHIRLLKQRWAMVTSQNPSTGIVCPQNPQASQTREFLKTHGTPYLWLHNVVVPSVSVTFVIQHYVKWGIVTLLVHDLRASDVSELFCNNSCGLLLVSLGLGLLEWLICDCLLFGDKMKLVKTAFCHLLSG